MTYFAAYIIIFVVVIGGLILLMLRRAKHEGGMEVITAQLQKALDEKTDEAKKLAMPARDRATVFGSLRSKAPK